MLIARFWKFCEIQLYILIFALPFEYYLDHRKPLLTTLKIQIVALLATWTFIKGVQFFHARDELFGELRRAITNRLLIAASVFALIQVLAAMLAPEFRANASRSAAKACAGVVLAFLVADLSSKRDWGESRFSDVRINAIVAIVLAGLTVSLLGFGDWIGIKFLSNIVNLFQPAKYFLGDAVRFVSTMEYPNTAASYLAASFCAAFALIISRDPVRHDGLLKRTSAFTLILVLGAAISLTYSRGALAATIFAIAIATWIWKDKFEARYGWMTSGLCLAVLIAGAWPSYAVRQAAKSFSPPVLQRNANYGGNASTPTKNLAPDKTYREDITVENNSPHIWRRGEFGLAYRWYSLKTDENSPLQVASEFRTDIPPKQKEAISASFRTPQEEGEYLLIWFVFKRLDGIHELENSYSPGIMCMVFDPKTKTAESFSPQAKQYIGAIDEERRTLSKTRVPQRRELWVAALRMFWSRPLLGWGPDSFRLLKQRFLAVPSGDDTILANNLYLELLSGSGILGLLSFLWVLWEIGRTVFSRDFAITGPGGLAVGCFGVAYLTELAVHGFVDYFLKFTPTFVLFWVILGLLVLRPRTDGAVVCE